MADDVRQNEEGNEESAEVRPQGVAPGRQNMGDILAKRREQQEDETKRTQELMRGPAPEPESTEEKRAAEGDETPKPAAAAEKPPEGAPAASPQPESAAEGQPQKFKFKVNGREVELTAEELTIKAQLGIGAHEVFAEAKRLKQEAAAERAEIERLAKLLKPDAVAAPAEAAPEKPADPLAKVDFAKIGDAISFGTDEERATAIRDLATALRDTSGSPAQPVDPQKLAEEVAQTVETRQAEKRDREHALNTFASEFPEIVDETKPFSRLLTYGAAEYAKQLMEHNRQTGVDMPLVEVYRKAGSYIRNQVKGLTDGSIQEALAKAGTTAASSALQTKEERKAGAPQPPAPAANVRAEATPEKRPMTPSEYVKKLQSTRPGSQQRPAA